MTSLIEFYVKFYKGIIYSYTERSKRNKMGSARPTPGVMLGRHDSEDLVHETGHLRARPPSAL